MLAAVKKVIRCVCRKWRWLAGTCLLLLLLPVAAWYLLPFCITPPELPQAPDTRVYDRNGEFLGLIPDKDGYRHQRLTELPTELVRCLVAAEDKRFYDHGGVDLLSTARAAWGRMTGSSLSGASTLTMQLAKMSNPPTERNYSAKWKEALQARALEYNYSKEEILLAYLNTADFGNQCRGAEAAALYYFNKSATELQTHEAALLAALVRAPSRLNPLRNPQAALTRRNCILEKLGERTDYPLGVQAHRINAPTHLTKSPGKLTLDATLQRDITDIAREQLQHLRRNNVSQAAVVVIDNRSGELLAAVPVADFSGQRGSYLNGTSTPRSAGSTLKPFVYLQSFGSGAWPGTIMADVKTLYRSDDGIRAPGNYNEQYLGPITIRQALGCSQNIPAMEALNRYGNINRLLELLRSLGMNLSGDAKEYGLGLAIGNAHVTLTELTHAYSTLARGGSKLPLHTHLPHDTVEATPLLNPQHCYQIAHILQDRNARSATFGRGETLSFPFKCAAKTGTSSNFRDNWCCGFTAEYTVGVWVGNFDNTPMNHVSGISGAAPIFHRVMLRLQEYNREPLSFPTRPEGLTDVEIDTRSGTPATATTPAQCRATEYATTEQLQNMPKATLDTNGKVVLDARYTEWFKQHGNRQLYSLDATASTGRRPAILIPAHGTYVTLDPTLPNGGRYIELRATMPTAVTQWSSNTLPIEEKNGKYYAVLKPGRHTIRASAPPNIEVSATFTVVE